MSVVVEIKGKVNFDDLIDKNIDYAGKDTAYRMCPPSEKLKVVTFFNPYEVGRGVEVEKRRGKVILKLFAASTSYDVDVFYEVIKRICKINNQDYFLREGEKYSVSDIDDNLLPNEQVNNIASFDTLCDIVRKEKETINIFGARNPISIDQDLLQHLRYDFKKYEKFITNIQHAYEYYAGTFLIKKKKEKIGFLMIETDKDVVIPLKPKIVNVDAPKDLIVDKWYIGNLNGFIKFENFIKYYEDEDLYDADHIMIHISEERFAELLKEYENDSKELISK